MGSLAYGWAQVATQGLDMRGLATGLARRRKFAAAVPASTDMREHWREARRPVKRPDERRSNLGGKFCCVSHI